MRFPYFRKRKYLLILKIWRLSQPDFRIVSMEILIMTPSGEVMICDANHLNLWGGANPVWENPRKDLGGGSVWVWGAGIYSARSLFTTWCNSSRADPCVLAEPIFQVIMWSVPLLLGRITQMLSREEIHVDASSLHCRHGCCQLIEEHKHLFGFLSSQELQHYTLIKSLAPKNKMELK